MARVEAVDPVKLLVAILFCDTGIYAQAIEELLCHWGQLDFTGDDHPFDMTDYYQPEMGPGLVRRLVAFADLVPPESLREAKLVCNRIEDRLAGGQGRRVNLDIGYLDRSKIVLASVKSAGQKIHLGDGVWADLVGRYGRGRYQPFEWTFPDFRDGRYDKDLSSIRTSYLAQLRTRKKA